MDTQLKHYRQKAGLSQSQLAKLAGFRDGQRRISHYENSNRRPSLIDCRMIIFALNQFGIECSLDDVFPPIDYSKSYLAGSTL